jgi:hypothetical protein
VPGGHEALKRDLDTMGVQHEETQGHYGMPERSFLIYGLPREHLVALGQKYGQEAVIHNEDGRREFIYTAGPNAGKMHPGLTGYEHWPEGSEPPEDYYTHVPGNGYVRLHFDFDHVDTAPVILGRTAAGPTVAASVWCTDGVPQHVAAEVQMTKAEALHQLWRMVKSLDVKAPFKHPHAYQWHDGHSDHHYRGHGPGGVLISTRIAKHDPEAPAAHPHTDGAIPNKDPHAHATNDQSAKAGVKTYAQYALPFGHIDHDAKARGGSNLFHYDYNGKNDAVNKLVADHGFSTYYAGGKYGKPDLANRNYNTKHLMVYDPSPDAGSSFGDQTYTDSWRKTHELAHALAYPELNNIYGEGRRIGKLGAHRTLNEALRAVHWEWLAAHKQRELNKQIGIHVPDEVFNRELNTVMHDAAHRAVTGKFTEPSEEGFVPHSHAVPLETSLGLVREAARNLGLTGMHDLVKKSEGAIAVADDKKSLSIPEALHGLYKGLKEQVNAWEQKCLDLRKAELAKGEDDKPKREPRVMHGHPYDSPASKTYCGEYNHRSHYHRDDVTCPACREKMGSECPACKKMGKTFCTQKGEVEPSQPPLAGNGDGMQMSEDDKLEAYAKGELKFKKAELCKGTALCKCSDCVGLEKYAKGEVPMVKASLGQRYRNEPHKEHSARSQAAGHGHVSQQENEGASEDMNEEQRGRGMSSKHPDQLGWSKHGHQAKKLYGVPVGSHDLAHTRNLARKAESSMAKVTPAENQEWESMKQDAGVKGYAAGTGPHPKQPSAADKQWAAMKRGATKKGELPAGASPTGPQKDEGVVPGDKAPKAQATKSNEGAGGQIKKAAIPAAGGAAPKAAGAPPAMGAPKAANPIAGMKTAVAGMKSSVAKLPGAPAGGGAPKLPGMAKPAAAPKPAAGGAPTLKTEMKKAVVPPHAGPFAARAEASGKVGLDPTFSAAAPGGAAPSPFAAPPAVPAQAPAKVSSAALRRRSGRWPPSFRARRLRLPLVRRRSCRVSVSPPRSRARSTPPPLPAECSSRRRQRMHVPASRFRARICSVRRRSSSSPGLDDVEP